ncbi:uncharacterized protein LOC132943462 [Metopolophium dirhodum]|uniref:uncharacterized protein LOC132943462 n=1 Tax=Metopolophium dirhodum TaxID=44670 RepID=UPI00298F6976|nr:uncharacterized protein LOC132943462 [Metopolophium dirhodum]
MSSKVTFTFEEDSLLADYVSRHPCLYDLQHNAYKDIHIKENVWKEIATRLKKSVDDCKKRFKNMKDTYNKKRRSRKMGTGSAAKDKPSKWMLEDMLSFLDKTIYERPTLTNVTSIEESSIHEDNDDLHESNADIAIEPEDELSAPQAEETVGSDTQKTSSSIAGVKRHKKK